MRVYDYDNLKPLVYFWQILLRNASDLAKRVRQYKQITPEVFYHLQTKILNLTDKAEIAVLFYVLNRASYNGTTLFGGMSPGHPRFTSQSIESLEKFALKDLTVNCADFKMSISKHENDFLYCDPPYYIPQKLYRDCVDLQIGFDHLGLAKILKACDKWILSYNDCEEIRNLYQKHLIVLLKWIYSMNYTKKSNEVIILSKDY